MIVGNILIFIMLLPLYVLIYQVRNYLKSKPFGLQTVLDSLAKDGTIIFGFRLLSNWILVITMPNEVVPDEYNYYIVMSIWKLNLFFGISFVVQCAIFSVIRYLFVFHFNFINTKSERKIKIITRTCVVALASLCPIIDDFTKSREFLYLTRSQSKEKDVPKNNYLSYISSIIVACVSISIIVVVQIKIVYEKRKIPEPLRKYKWDFFNLKTVSLALLILVAFSLLTILEAFVNVFAISLISSTLRGYIVALVIILILIKSNNRMYEYVKKKILPEFILKDLEMYQRIYSNSTTESNQTLPTYFRTSELNAHNNFPQSNHVQAPNIFVIPESIDNVEGRNLPNQININLASNIQPSVSTLPDVSM